MKYPCNMVRDLLPLYIDEVCSEESRKIIKEHLDDCSECRNYWGKITEMSEITEQDGSIDWKNENRKANSLREVKRKIAFKQVLSAMIAILIVCVTALLAIGALKSTVRIVPYKENLSALMIDGNLVGRLYGSEYANVKIKTVEVNETGERYLFYQVSDTAWRDLLMGENTFSEYILCPKDKGANTIDKVYYYTDDYEELDNMDDSELESAIQNAKLLWQKNN